MRISDWSSDVCSSDLGVAEQDVSLIDQLGNVRHQIEQAQIVADVFARLADARANLGVFEIEQLAQPLHARRGFHRRQRFALQIFDQAEPERFGVRQIDRQSVVYGKSV